MTILYAAFLFHYVHYFRVIYTSSSHKRRERVLLWCVQLLSMAQSRCPAISSRKGERKARLHLQLLISISFWFRSRKDYGWRNVQIPTKPAAVARSQLMLMLKNPRRGNRFQRFCQRKVVTPIFHFDHFANPFNGVMFSRSIVVSVSSSACSWKRVLSVTYHLTVVLVCSTHFLAIIVACKVFYIFIQVMCVLYVYVYPFFQLRCQTFHIGGCVFRRDSGMLVFRPWFFSFVGMSSENSRIVQRIVNFVEECDKSSPIQLVYFRKSFINRFAQSRKRSFTSTCETFLSIW